MEKGDISSCLKRVLRASHETKGRKSPSNKATDKHGVWHMMEFSRNKIQYQRHWISTPFLGLSKTQVFSTVAFKARGRVRKVAGHWA